MKRLLSIPELNRILACPSCKRAIQLIFKEDVICNFCKEKYTWQDGSCNFVPQNYNVNSEIWKTWDQLQTNGLMSYIHDPEHNLGIGNRRDYLDFGYFCGYDGLVLDVGCGPQPWPTHFKTAPKSVRFIGIDPLIEKASIKYTQFRALGEYLPFRNSVFNHVVFATSLDHFIDPIIALKEAARVCSDNGKINIWIGEKDADAPPFASTGNWYLKLNKPEKADDLFHIKRLTNHDVRHALRCSGLSISEEKVIKVDSYRRNIFYRVNK